MKVIVSNIQRFSLHDGAGIRTTVFFKGCNLKCPWCTNPENMEFDIQEYNYQDESGTYGYEIELDKLEEEILKDEKFYKNGGGVTFSGGEPLWQFEKIEPLLKNLRDKKINICIETVLTVPEKLVDIALKYVDQFIIDIKIIDETAGRINGNAELYMKNIDKVFKQKNNVIFRIPLAEGYIVTDENMSKILELLKKYKPEKVEIFKLHRLGEKKYKTLGREMPEFKEISNEKISEVKKQIEDLGIKVEFCKI